MTYWPISSPSVFAATKNTNPERTPISHDGIDEVSQSERDIASESDVTTGTDEDTSEDGLGEAKEEEKQQANLQSTVPDQFVEDDVHGEIIAIRVTRSGQLFATLTRTTLTIWQTKVCPWLPCNQTTLIYQLAHRHPCLGLALAAVFKDLRPEHRRPTSA